MLREIEARGDVNIFSYLKHIRTQRAHLVQTEEQYVFIHDALVEVIEAGETHINKTALPRYIHSLQCIDVTDEKNHPPKVLEKQHKVRFLWYYVFAAGKCKIQLHDCDTLVIESLGSEPQMFVLAAALVVYKQFELELDGSRTYKLDMQIAQP